LEEDIMANTPTTPKKEENRTGQQMDKARDAASQAADKSREAASAVGDAVGHAASAVGATVGNVASSVGSSVSHAASAAGQKADDLTSSAGSSIKNFGETLRQKGPQEGMLGSATQAVANTVEASGKYLEEAGVSGMMDDLGEVIRRNPFPAVLVGVGIGILIGRALRS
jgi:ElaB/YqjD/DUF883 family membrane-anchored ribosome-binding protein